VIRAAFVRGEQQDDRVDGVAHVFSELLAAALARETVAMPARPFRWTTIVVRGMVHDARR